MDCHFSPWMKSTVHGMPPPTPSSSTLNVKLCASRRTFCPSQDMTFSICQHFPRRTGEVGPRSGILFRVLWWNEEHPLQWPLASHRFQLFKLFHRMSMRITVKRFPSFICLDALCAVTLNGRAWMSSYGLIENSIIEFPPPPQNYIKLCATILIYCRSEKNLLCAWHMPNAILRNFAHGMNAWASYTWVAKFCAPYKVFPQTIY